MEVQDVTQYFEKIVSELLIKQLRLDIQIKPYWDLAFDVSFTYIL